MDKESTIGLMEINIKESGSRTRDRGRASLNKPMATNLKANGKMI
jgi:hypothetical protein